MGALFDYLVFPLFIPFILLWLLAARLLSFVAPLLVPLTWSLAARLSWACPFIPRIWELNGWFKGTLMRMGFEWTYCMNVSRRFLTLPLRRRTADFYIVGFPKAGTTSMAAYLKLHPAIDGIDGLPWHETLEKESHHFQGALGRRAAASKLAYRSYFPTVLRRWWVERVRRAGKWLCFDACPVNACLDYTAARMAAFNPDAKLIFMLRDPVSGAFSAEIMLRNLGVPLSWSLMEDVRPADPRFAETPADVRYWEQVAALGPKDVLPPDLMHRFYHDCYALLRSGRYADRIAPFLKHFKRENCMFISFTEFCSNTEEVVRKACEFVGADPSLLHFCTLPPGMQGERKGRRMHPSCKRKLAQYFAEPNQRLYAMLGVDFNWADPEALGRSHRDAAAFMAPAPQPSYPVGSGLDGRSGAEVGLPPLPPGLHPPPPAAGEGAGGAGAAKQAEQQQQRGGSSGGSSKGSDSGSSVVSVTASSGRTAGPPALATVV
ncbi:hypothetical protein ABPG75_012758 [Micractinium tetrahymenae]